MASKHDLKGSSTPKIPSVKLKRHFERALDDPETRNSILDAAIVGHFATTLDGFPIVVPTTFARVGEDLFIHGSHKNRAMRAASGKAGCFEVTILDALLYTTRAFNHSMNYRSVVAYGIMEEISERAEKEAALAAIVDRFEVGRSAKLPANTNDELRQTIVLRLPLAHWSAKARTGDPAADVDGLGEDTFVGTVEVAERAHAQTPLSGSTAARVDLPRGLGLA